MGGDGNCLYARGEAVAVEHERVEAGLALDLVTAIAVVPDERIVAGAEGRHVVAFAAQQMCGGQRLPCGRRYVVERDRVVAVPAEHIDFGGVDERRWGVSLNGYRSVVDENVSCQVALDRDVVGAVVSSY